MSGREGEGSLWALGKEAEERRVCILTGVGIEVPSYRVGPKKKSVKM